MQYRLNFLTPTTEAWKRQRIRKLTLLTYLLLWGITGIVFYQVYDAFAYMAIVLDRKVSLIENEIAGIEPRVMLLERKIEERDGYRREVNFYLQTGQRPGVWSVLLQEVSNIMPAELVLDKLTYVYQSTRTPKSAPDLILEGHFIIKSNDQDVHLVDVFRARLMDNPFFRHLYPHIAVRNTHISKKADDLYLTFSIGMNS